MIQIDVIVPGSNKKTFELNLTNKRKITNKQYDEVECYAFVLVADGLELDMILDRMTNIPICKGKVKSCVWHGDFAKFIFSNLSEYLVDVVG